MGRVAKLDMMTKHKCLIDSSELIEGEPVELVIDGNIIIVARVEGKVYAVDGICTHAYAELIDGGLDDHCLVCPLHFACFDIRDGSVLEGPTDVPLKTYNVVEKDGKVWIELGDGEDD